MRRKRSLFVEPMEGRVVLSSLSYDLTTDQSVYQAGQPVQMSLIVTNTGDQATSLIVGPSDSEFIVSQGGQTVWREPGLAMDLENVTLQPGQSWTEKDTWDPAITAGGSIATTTGSFVVTNQFAPSAVSATFQIQSPLSYSLTAPQGQSAFGQPIALSYTITNTSDQAVTFSLDPTDFVVTRQGNTPVWESDPGAASQPATSQTLQPGQSLTESATWNGVADEGKLAGTDVWDDFNVSVLGAPPAMTQDIGIASPLTLKVATDQQSYQAGQSVQITGTVTDTSDQPVTVLDTQDTFTVMGYGGPVLPAVDISTSEPVVTLQPGQSQTFTATWNSGSYVGSTPPGGSYNILFQDNFEGTTSPQFTIDVPSGSGASSGDPTPPAGGSGPGSSPPTSQAPTGQAGTPIVATLQAGEPSGGSGTPDRITLTLKNTGEKPVHLASLGKTEEITILRGSTVVSRTTRHLSAARSETLKAGRSLRFTTLLGGKSSPADVRRLIPGSYTVEVDLGDYTASTAIQIGGSTA